MCTSSRNCSRPGRDAEFNIEGNPFHAVLELVREVRPQQCTLVPDDPAAFTSDHGWDLRRDGARLKPVIAGLTALGIRVSLFMDPLPEAMAAARNIGADRVELYTEPYARAFGTAAETAELARYAAAAQAAQQAGLGVNAGHDLNQDNLPRFLSAVPGVLEVSIGHALIADALECGLAQTVRDYLAAVGAQPAMQQRGKRDDLRHRHRRGRAAARRTPARKIWRALRAPGADASGNGPVICKTVRPVLFLANRFAAKEAFSKAMGTGFRYPVTLQCISVVQDRRRQARVRV